MIARNAWDQPMGHVDRRRWFWPPTERQAWRQYFDTLCWDEANGYAATAEERRLLMRMARHGNVFWRNEGSRPATQTNSLLGMRYEDISELQ